MITIAQRDVIKEYFESLYLKFNNLDYIGTDPIIFPHTYGGNIEYISFTASLFAYGNVKAIQSFLTYLFNTAGTDPFNINSYKISMKYRFQNEFDISSYLEIMHQIYCDHGSLENYFLSFSDDPLIAATSVMRDINERYIVNKTHGLKFLFTIPGKSASKRLYMFLRWMIRKDDIDFGIWNNYCPSKLSIPLDTHMRAMSSNLGIIEHNSSDTVALKSVNSFFRYLNPDDPVKYDFSITRLGIHLKCSYKDSTICNSCEYTTNCVYINKY